MFYLLQYGMLHKYCILLWWGGRPNSCLFVCLWDYTTKETHMHACTCVHTSACTRPNLYYTYIKLHGQLFYEYASVCEIKNKYLVTGTNLCNYLTIWSAHLKLFYHRISFILSYKLMYYFLLDIFYSGFTNRGYWVVGFSCIISPHST